MELRVLEYFLVLAREGSVSVAAETLHISQPTLSRQLIDLERELGCTLFERGRHGITLTEDGALLRRRAAEIANLVHITETEIMLNRGIVAGEIRIGCAETRAMDLLADVMQELQSEHPQVTYRITSGLAEDMAELLGHGLLDFGLLLRVRDSWRLHSIRLPSSDAAVVIMRADSPLAELDRVSLDDLATQPVLAPSSFRASGILGGELPRAEGGRLDVRAEFDMPYNATRMVLAGMGCAVVLAGLIDARPMDDLAVRPLDVEFGVPSYLVWKPFQLRTRACEAFLERVRLRWGD